MSPTNLIKEYFPELSQEVESQMLQFMEDLSVGANFHILVTKKTIEKQGDYLKRVTYRCVTMSPKGKDIIFIDSDQFLDGQSFEKTINKYVGLEVYGLEKKVKQVMVKDIRKRLYLLKKFCDFCDTNNVFVIEERVSYFGYSREDNKTIVFGNGTLDQSTNSFISKKSSIKNPNAIMFEDEEGLSLADSISEFAKFPQGLLTQDSQIFVLAGFFGASIWANEFFNYFHNFPQLYLFGPRGCGKSFGIKTLMGITGFVKQEPTDLSKITNFALLDLMESLSRYFFMDDFSTAKNKAFVNNMLRSNYDRLPSSRGSIGNNYENRGPKTDHYHNDSVMITGSETLPNDEALLTRLIIIQAGKGYTHEFRHDAYEEFVAKYRKLFFNIVKNKNQLNIRQYIDEAYGIIEKHNITFYEKRIENNVIILVAGNLILGQKDEAWIVNNIHEYLHSYDKMFKLNTFVQGIINDILCYPDEYLSLEKFVIKQQKYPLFIHDGKLFIRIRLLIGIFKRRHPSIDVDLTKIENELKTLLGISGKVADKETNYYDFSNKRDKGLALGVEQVKTNKYLVKLWNIFLSKLAHDVDKQRNYVVSEELEAAVSQCINTHGQIDMDVFGETGETEK